MKVEYGSASIAKLERTNFEMETATSQRYKDLRFEIERVYFEKEPEAATKLR